MNEDKHNSLNANLLHAYDLIFALCEERITPEQFRQLDDMVCNDPEVRSFYVDVMALRSSLRWFAFYLRPPLPLDPPAGSISGDEMNVEQLRNSLNESLITAALMDVESNGPGESAEVFQPTPFAPVEPRSPLNSFVLANIKGIAAVVLLAVGLVAYVSLFRAHLGSGGEVAVPPGTIATGPQPVTPPPLLVATLNFTEKSVWSAAYSPPPDGKFFTGQSLQLQSGAVQLSLQHGGRLVVEGPVDVEFAALDRIALRKGKLAATVPGGGLVVDCPNGSVTDLGTQFGIQVNPDQSTDVAVFQGHVSASLRSTATTQGITLMALSEGQALSMSANALSIDGKGSMPQQFIRSLLNNEVTSLDVIDLVNGGDGTTRRRGISINPLNGEIGKLDPGSGGVTDRNYHRVSGYPFVDGAFIADVANDATVINSAGNRFQFAGIGNTTSINILTGGKLPTRDATEIGTVLNGVDYSTADHGMMLIHPNDGITFDLNAVRRIYPDRVLTRFHCKVGISDPANRTASDAAAFVLTDGTLRFQKPHFGASDGSFDVDLTINETDRFLTLVSTFAGKGSFNRVIWVDAKLDLSASR